MAQLRKYKILIKQFVFDKEKKNFNSSSFQEFEITDLTCDITVVKNSVSQSGKSRVVLRNLSIETIDSLVQDRYANFTDNTVNLGVEGTDKNSGLINGVNLFPLCRVSIGYDDELVNVFEGIIDSVTTRREGTELVVDMDLTDQGFYYIRKKLNSGPISLKKGVTTLETAIQSLYKLAEQISTEYTLNLEDSEFLTADLKTVYSGETKNVITSNGTFNDTLFQIISEFGITKFNKNNASIVINEGILTFLLDRNPSVPSISTSEFEVSDETGLLQPPVRVGGFISISTVFNPYIKIGSKVNLKSKILKKYNTDTVSLISGSENGLYTVQGVQHNVRFSDTVNGQAVTEIKLFVGAKNFGVGGIYGKTAI